MNDELTRLSKNVSVFPLVMDFRRLTKVADTHNWILLNTSASYSANLAVIAIDFNDLARFELFENPRGSWRCLQAGVMAINRRYRARCARAPF